MQTAAVVLREHSRSIKLGIGIMGAWAFVALALALPTLAPF